MKLSSGSFALIVAMDKENGMAKNGDLPWQKTVEGKEDMKWFKERTYGSLNLPRSSEEKKSSQRSILIMGRKTMDSIPSKFFPLPGRINVVVSRSYSPLITIFGMLTNSPVVYVNSLTKAIEWAQTFLLSTLRSLNVEEEKEEKEESTNTVSDSPRIIVIGGLEIYQQVLKHPDFKMAIVTKFHKSYSCDLFFPLESLASANKGLKKQKEVVTKNASYSFYY
jgi:dihydrofolate reductase